MAQKIANIAKNTSFFTMALILQKVISFTYFAILARNLMPEDLGKYYLAISFATIFAIFMDLGLINVLTREVAKKQSRAGELLGNALIIKIPLSLLSLAALYLLVNLMDYPEITRQLVYISSISVLLDSFTFVFYAVIRAHHNLKFESLGSVLYQLITFVIGIAALKAGYGIKVLMAALLAASLFNFTYSLLLVRFKWKIVPEMKIRWKLIVSMATITLPFGIYAVLQRLYIYLDSILLSVLAGDRFVGLYQVPFKVIFALQFLPMAFIASLYPAFSSYWHSNREQLSTTFIRAINYLVVISLPISAGIIILAEDIIDIFKPEYSDSVFLLRIVVAAIPFMFVNFPIGSLLNACDRQKANTLNMGLTLLFSVFLNILLIPILQAIGASITVLMSNIFMFLLGLYWLPKVIVFPIGRALSIIFKSLAALAVMSAFTLATKDVMNIFLVIVLSGMVYFGAQLMLGGFRRDDIASIIASFKKKNA